MDNSLDVKQIKEGLFSQIKADTMVGVYKGKFDNSEEIISELNATSVPDFFDSLKKRVKEYYESN